MYLADVTLGGAVEDILHDLDIMQVAEEFGLTLNNSKSAMTHSYAKYHHNIPSRGSGD